MPKSKCPQQTDYWCIHQDTCKAGDPGQDPLNNDPCIWVQTFSQVDKTSKATRNLLLAMKEVNAQKRSDLIESALALFTS